MDIADNDNTASNVLRVTFDRATPGPTLSTDAASPTNAASVTVAVDFGKRSTRPPSRWMTSPPPAGRPRT